MTELNNKLVMLRTITNRLARALSVLVVVFVAGALYAHYDRANVLSSAPMAAFTVGVIGGFVGLQRRLKSLSDDDLTLLAHSWVYVCLSPLVGGILAVVVYVLFVSGLLAGDLFTCFAADPDSNGAATASTGLAKIFAIHGDAEDYAKMLFWSFVAGFSERFATDIISRLETSSGRGNTPDS